jgi:hypothetical protein
MKNFFISFFIITTAVFGVLFAVQMKDAGKFGTQITELTQQHEDAVKEADTLRKQVAVLTQEKEALSQDKKTLEQEVADYKTQMEDLETVVAKTQESADAAEAAAKAGEDQEGAAKFAEGLAEMMDTPEMRETVRMQIQGAVIEPIYGSLMKSLNMSAEDREKFTEILMEKYMAGMDMFGAMQSGDPEDYKKVQADIEQRQKEVDGKIKELLGDENYKKYEYYQQTEQERMVVGQFNQRLAYSNNPISEDQHEQLVKLMYEEKQAAKDDPGYFNPEKAGPDELTDEGIDNLARIQVDINRRVRDRADSVLEEDQLLAFEKFQDAFLQQQLMGLRMASQMFKPKKEE